MNFVWVKGWLLLASFSPIEGKVFDHFFWSHAFWFFFYFWNLAGARQELTCCVLRKSFVLQSVTNSVTDRCEEPSGSLALYSWMFGLLFECLPAQSLLVTRYGNTVVTQLDWPSGQVFKYFWRLEQLLHHRQAYEDSGWPRGMYGRKCT